MAGTLGVDPRTVAAGRGHEVADPRARRQPEDTGTVDRADDLDDERPCSSALQVVRPRLAPEAGSLDSGSAALDGDAASG